ncbi:MAG: alpha-amylase, partial [Chitinophagaceae bacterium]
MRKLLVFVSLVCLAVYANAQNLYPTHWWTGMKNPKLQLMVHSENIATKLPMYKLPASGMKLAEGITLKLIHRVENPNYVFLDLVIDKNAKPGMRTFSFGSPANKVSFNYELKAKEKGDGVTRIQGVTAKDFIYLMMPDRFSNGDPSNDIVNTYRDVSSDRANKFSRHGGDFKGITDHLNYFDELGVTTLWLTPVIENDMPLMSEWGNNVAGYHGYWFTDHYQVDKRLGGNEGYKAFCDALHQRGMKVIQDAVYNHVGSYHWFIRDLPMKDWVNNLPASQGPNHKEEVFFDPYVAAIDKKVMTDGWFVPHLPDLNQRNPYVANFLIQHAIWTTQEFGIDGWRVDTYKYCDEQFMNNVNTALEKEFPKLTVFGESWVSSITANAYFTRNNMKVPFKHNAKGMLDFQTCFGMLAAMNEPGNGINKLYSTLAQDVLYKDPMNNCIFLDNHDMDRVFSVVDEDWSRLKAGITWLLTMRGIPQLYYGTEVLMKNKKVNTDATVREDFPGGWSGDQTNRFLATGRTEQQNAAFRFTSALAKFRKSSSAITTGKTMQYAPRDGLYIYFRYDQKQTVMVVVNTTDKAVKPDWSYYSERVGASKQMKDVVTGKTI